MEIISLGAGVQSSTMALMAKHGEITPMPDCAIFADTQAEPASVYTWLDWLEKQLPFPIHRVTRGNLGVDSLRVRVSKKGNKYTKHAIPAFMVDAAGKTGIMMRQCTSGFKIVPIQQKIKMLVGKKGQCTQWIGISLDEVQRMKPSRKKYISNRWPLIEMRMTRSGCLSWMKKHGYPTPPRSACVFCPFHSAAEWNQLKKDEPIEFQKAASYESDLQKTMTQVSGFRGKPFLNRLCIPISEIDFNGGDKADQQSDLFPNECEGVCGV